MEGGVYVHGKKQYALGKKKTFLCFLPFNAAICLAFNGLDCIKLLYAIASLQLQPVTLFLCFPGAQLQKTVLTFDLDTL